MIQPLMKVRKVTEGDYPDLLEKLKQAQKERDISISELCRKAEISTQYWYRIIKGQVDTLNLDTLRKIEAALGVDLGVKFDEP